MLSHGTARRGHAAVVAGGSQGGDPCLSVPIAILGWEPIAAFGAAAGVEPAPAVDTKAVALKALVDLARGEIEAHWARQGLHGFECSL